MAYDPADLRLPSWLLRSLNHLVAIRIPLAKHWRIGCTRAGALMFFSLLGLWAAAFYSANNLLYLCGGMLTAIALGAIWQGVLLLRRCPPLGAAFPKFIEADNPIVLRQSVPNNIASPALIHFSWENCHIQANLRCDGSKSTILAHYHNHYRTFATFTTQHIKTSAPLGLWEVEFQRQDPLLYVVLPQAIAWLDGQNLEQQQHQSIEGDEFHDLRAYVAGDTVARIHWRKSTLEPSTWRIKRFSQPEGNSHQKHLRLDLRLPSHQSQADFEHLLGMAWYWLKSQPQQAQAQCIIGQKRFDLADKKQYQQAAQAIAAAKPETQAPLQTRSLQTQGLLLSLMPQA